jgi:hypothetical protein
MVALLTLAFAASTLLQISILDAITNILSNPLSIVTILVGGAVITASVGALGYLALGALADGLGGGSSGIGRQPPQRD